MRKRVRVLVLSVLSHSHRDFGSGAKGSPGLGSLGQSGHQEVEEVFCRPARPLERRFSMGMNELFDSSSSFGP